MFAVKICFSHLSEQFVKSRLLTCHRLHDNSAFRNSQINYRPLSYGNFFGARWEKSIECAIRNSAVMSRSKSFRTSLFMIRTRVSRFQREARLLASLNHPTSPKSTESKNLPEHSIFRADGRAILELCDLGVQGRYGEFVRSSSSALSMPPHPAPIP